MLSPHSKTEKENMSWVSYASAVESLKHAIVCTWSNLAYVISDVSKFMSQYVKEHWQAV